MNSIRIGRNGLHAIQNKALEQNDLLTWTIYDHPDDFPHAFVVRPFSSKMACPLTVHFEAQQLDAVRAALMHMGLTCLTRSETDPPERGGDVAMKKTLKERLAFMMEGIKVQEGFNWTEYEELCRDALARIESLEKVVTGRRAVEIVRDFAVIILALWIIFK